MCNKKRNLEEKRIVLSTYVNNIDYLKAMTLEHFEKCFWNVKKNREICERPMNTFLEGFVSLINEELKPTKQATSQEGAGPGDVQSLVAKDKAVTPSQEGAGPGDVQSLVAKDEAVTPSQEGAGPGDVQSLVAEAVTSSQEGAGPKIMVTCDFDRTLTTGSDTSKYNLMNPEGIKNSLPNKRMVDTLIAYLKQIGCRVFILTGRDVSLKETIYEWLMKHGIHINIENIICKTGNGNTDIFKSDKIKHLQTVYSVRYILSFDDMASTLEAIMKSCSNTTCLQVKKNGNIKIYAIKNNGLIVFSGPPGTGKTVVSKALYEALQELGVDVMRSSNDECAQKRKGDRTKGHELYTQEIREFLGMGKIVICDKAGVTDVKRLSPIDPQNVLYLTTFDPDSQIVTIERLKKGKPLYEKVVNPEFLKIVTDRIRERDPTSSTLVHVERTPDDIKRIESVVTKITLEGNKDITKLDSKRVITLDTTEPLQEIMHKVNKVSVAFLDNLKAKDEVEVEAATDKDSIKSKSPGYLMVNPSSDIITMINEILPPEGFNLKLEHHITMAYNPDGNDMEMFGQNATFEVSCTPIITSDGGVVVLPCRIISDNNPVHEKNNLHITLGTKSGVPASNGQNFDHTTVDWTTKCLKFEGTIVFTRGNK